MAQECMAIFERDKLPLVAGVEQVKLSVFVDNLVFTIWRRIARQA
jgi:hypothetical protein